MADGVLLFNDVDFCDNFQHLCDMQEDTIYKFFEMRKWEMGSP